MSRKPRTLAQVASVRPYPSSSGMPVAFSKEVRTPSGRAEAPTIAQRIDPMSAPSTGQPARTEYTVGTALMVAIR